MERSLVERAMRGDKVAFDTLIERHGDHLHSVARRILRDTYLAEDATQRALLDTWRNRVTPANSPVPEPQMARPSSRPSLCPPIYVTERGEVGGIRGTA